MSLSKARDRERNGPRMREVRATKKAERAKAKAGGTALLPKAMVRRLQRLGVDPGRYLTMAPVSLGDYHALERAYAARTARVEWQSGGIRGLQAEITTLKALVATLPAMQDDGVRQRLIQLETQQALHEAEHTVSVEEYQRTPEQEEVALTLPFKDFRRFVDLHRDPRLGSRR